LKFFHLGVSDGKHRKGVVLFLRGVRRTAF
jgi:hypothetical protein